MKSKDSFSSLFSYWRFVVFCLIIISSFLMPSAKASEAKSKWGNISETGFAFVLDHLQIVSFVTLYYDLCEKHGVLFDPSISKLTDSVTLRTPSLTCEKFRPIFSDAISRIGAVVESKGSYDLVRLEVKDDRSSWVEFIYSPVFRDALELAELVHIVVRKGSFAHQRHSSVVQLNASAEVPDTGSNGASMAAKQIDKLVFFGPSSEAKAVEGLLSRLDVPSGQIEIRAGIYEYQTGKNEGSAINAAIKLFNAKLGLSISGGAQSGSSVKIGFPGIDAVLSLLDEDTRFRYVARPTVLAKDGEAVRFFSGEDVRVVGAIVLDRNGNPIQSKETLSAGVLLEATPRVRGEIVDISLYQAVSNFVATASGDPSILKRDLRSRLMMQPGAVYVIGGLKSSRRTQSSNHLFGLPVGNSDEQSETELLLLVSVNPEPAS